MRSLAPLLAALVIGCGSEDPLMAAHVSINPYGKRLVIWMVSASNGIARDAEPSGLPTSYHGRNLQTAQADILFAPHKESAIWDTTTHDPGWTTLQATGDEISSVPAPRHAHEMTLGADLVDAAKIGPIGIISYAVGGSGYVEFDGATGTSARSNLTTRLADIGEDYEVIAVVRQLGRPDMNDEADSLAVATRAAAFETAFRALDINGASTAIFYDFEPHSSVGVGATYRANVVSQIAAYVAGDTTLRRLITEQELDIRGNLVTVDDAVDDHWLSPGCQQIGRIGARRIWIDRLYPALGA